MGAANISYGYVGALARARGVSPLFTEDTSEVLTTDAITSAATTAAAPDEQNRELAVRVMLSELGWIKIGAAPTADRTTSMKCQADVEYFFAIAPGHKVAVLDDA